MTFNSQGHGHGDGGLVGRDAPLRQLADVLREARRGEGQLVFVTGEPGIGKTAVAEAATAAAAQEGMQSYWGRCWEGGGAAPFWPWVQVLRAALVDAGEDALMAELGPLLAPAGQNAADGATAASVTGFDARLRLFENVTAALRAVADREGPIAIVLEDLHAADESSLQLLRYVARSVSELPLAIVATFRQADIASSPERHALVKAAARFGVTVPLAGLEEHDVGVLLGTAPGVSTAAVVHAATGGNPFLVIESVRLLTGGTDPPQLRLPAGARAIVHERLEALSPPVRSVLRRAALLGREFELATTAWLTDIPPDDLLDRLSEAADAHVVTEAGLGVWAFTHALLREELLEELDADGSANLHRRAAAALWWRHGDDPYVAAHVAHHMVQGRHAGAVDACVRAADVAAGRFGYEEAAAWAERAVDLLVVSTAEEERRRYALLRAVMDARIRQGKGDLAREAAARAFKSARACGSMELLAEAAVRIAPFAMSDPVVVTALDDALCDLPQGDSLVRAEAMVAFAWVMGSSSVSRTALKQINDAGLAMARRVAHGDELWPVLWQWHQTAFGDLESLEPRLGVAQELLRMAQRSGDPERLALAHLWHAVNLLSVGETANAFAHAQQSFDHAERLRQPFHMWAALSLQCWLELMRGDFAPAVERARRTRALGGIVDEASTLRGAAGLGGDTLAINQPQGTAAHGGFLSAEYEYDAMMHVVRRWLGEFEELVELTKLTLRRWPVYGLNCTRQVGLPLALAELGRHEEAKRHLDELLEEGVADVLFGMVTPYGRTDAPRLCCPTAVAEVCWIIGDTRPAPELYELLKPYADRHVIATDRESRGLCRRYLGMLAALMGRYEEADAHFQAAHPFHDRIGARPLSALGRRDHARMLQMWGRAQDRARARELLVAARDTFRELGMGVYAARSEAELDAIRGADPVVLRQEGEYWTVAYAGEEARVRDSKGMRYLARLIAEEGTELHALDLAGDGTEPELTRALAADVGPVLDVQAKAAYRRRLEALQGDAPGGEAAFLEDELARAVGLGGRDRRAASETERARQSVTRAIRSAIERVAENSPALGDHLRAAVRTGVYCAYHGEQP